PRRPKPRYRTAAHRGRADRARSRGLRRAARRPRGDEDPRRLPRVTVPDLSGRTALVTGARRGIGRAAADALAAAGARVVGVSAAADEIAGQAYRCDFADRTQVYELVAKVRRDLGGVDIAGTIERAPAVEHGDELWDRVLEVDLSAQFVLTRELGRDMVERGRGKV